MDNYGAKLKRLRLINGKNQEEIAEVIDRTKRSVYNYEIGKGQISLENAIKFCMECGEDISYLQDNEIINADVIIIPLIDYYSFDQAEYAINHIEKYNKEASVNLITIVDGEVEFSNYYELDELEMTKNQFLMAWNQCIKSKT